jgi:hypothetical protein
MIWGFAIDFLTGIFVGAVVMWLYCGPRIRQLTKRVAELEVSDQTHFNKWMRSLQESHQDNRPPQHDNRR